MTFKKFISHFRYVDLPIGDLARDILDDPNFPETNNQEKICEYLEKHHACDAAVKTFENAFNYYISEYGPV